MLLGSRTQPQLGIKMHHHPKGHEAYRLKAGDYKGKWVLLFFYPKDFTFVCPTEIIAFSDRMQEFESRNCAVIGASCDSAEVPPPCPVVCVLVCMLMPLTARLVGRGRVRPVVVARLS